MRIKKFIEFITETTTPEMDKSAQVSAVVSEIGRNYLNYPSLSAMKETDLNFQEEKRKWPNFIETAKLDTDIEAPGKFYMKFSKNGEEFEILIDFNVAYKGTENYDSDVADYFKQAEEGGARMGVALQKLRITRLQVKSDLLVYNEKRLLPDLNKTLLGFMLGVLKPEFDMISDETLVIRQL
jgi:hypothetical protein